MKHEFTNSSMLSWADYDEEHQILTIVFNSTPKEYNYEGVPKSIYDALLASESAGKFFLAQIKPIYKLV